VTSREVSLRTSTHGFEPSRFGARVNEFTRGDRARRALRRFLPIFGVACCVVLIPPHLPWITTVTITGAVLAFQRYREEREILDVRGPCPACAAEQTLTPPAALPAIQRCPSCGAFLKLEEE
jgi:hypothetical protein